ncbi:type II toxin-antitoxin system HicA family toxin [Helicobacter cinaedi]|uniref:Toxin-antitoxin system, toxin component, HicA family n=2 Tax=Helicobacter cinaedi TaxID=213 RepID=A0ABN0BA68_9HELI|nr:type II toxin-antitoxin system HicA family toxin [Helicobacter cinaedi]EFR45618.1 toxin-antitoxin system, toxin component, HicA family [Helicobacter cinaedi CCUG 18818 = ATCC BAA-847]QOQ91079.1 type II toxin-antitoxin system HicA family toxin [Helicobacter cinaedi]BBB20559.1 hypothetical protein HC081234_17360 [Helicobacter cinaedi]
MGDKLPKLTAKEAESLLLQNGFVVDRQKGSHKIYKKDSKRMVLPHHSGKTLHPKIIKALFEILED